MVASPGGDRLLDAFAEAGAVRKLGQAVVECLVPVLLGELTQFRLRLLVGGDVPADSLDADRPPVLLDDPARDVEDDRMSVLGDELLLERRALHLPVELSLPLANGDLVPLFGQ